MLMKKILFMLTMLVSICGFAANEEPDAIRVKLNSGTPVVILLSSNPEVTYTSTGATITATGQNPVTLDFDDIEFIDFVKSSSVKDLAATEGAVKLQVSADALLVSGAKAGSELAIYTLDGRCVLNTTIPESYSVNRSLLNTGVYIVKINKSTFKIIL